MIFQKDKSTKKWGKKRPFLSSSVPNLSLDDLAINIQAFGGKLDPYCGLGLQVELVPREPGEQVGFANTRITNQNQLEEVIVIIICFVPSHAAPAPLFLSSQLCFLQIPKRKKNGDDTDTNGEEFVFVFLIIIFYYFTRRRRRIFVSALLGLLLTTVFKLNFKLFQVTRESKGGTFPFLLRLVNWNISVLYVTAEFVFCEEKFRLG